MSKCIGQSTILLPTSNSCLSLNHFHPHYTIMVSPRLEPKLVELVNNQTSRLGEGCLGGILSSSLLEFLFKKWILIAIWKFSQILYLITYLIFVFIFYINSVEFNHIEWDVSVRMNHHLNGWQIKLTNQMKWIFKEKNEPKQSMSMNETN